MNGSGCGKGAVWYGGDDMAPECLRGVLADDLGHAVYPDATPTPHDHADIDYLKEAA